MIWWHLWNTDNQELHGSSELKYKEIVIGLKSAIIQLDLQKVHFLFLVQWIIKEDFLFSWSAVQLSVNYSY